MSKKKKERVSLREWPIQKNCHLSIMPTKVNCIKKNSFLKDNHKHSSPILEFMECFLN